MQSTSAFSAFSAKVSQTADQICDAEFGTRFTVTSEQSRGAGRSTFLIMLSQSLAARDLSRPIICLRSTQSYDCGLAMVRQVVAASVDHGEDPSVIARLGTINPLTAFDRAWNFLCNEDAIVLVDDLPFEAQNLNELKATDRVSRYVRQRLVNQGERITRIASHAPAWLGSHQIVLPHLDVISWLNDGFAWGDLSQIASKVAFTLANFGQRKLNLAEARALVSRIFLRSQMGDRSTSIERLLHSSTSHTSMLFDDLMNEGSVGQSLLRAWSALGLARMPISRTILRELFEAHNLSEWQSTLLRDGLCMPQANGNYSMHGLLKAEPRRAPRLLGGTGATDAHDIFARGFLNVYHLARDNHTGSHQEMLAAAGETIHHGIFANWDLDRWQQVQGWLVTDLATYGYHLSRHQREFKAAADVFEKALTIDSTGDPRGAIASEDSYLHHYLAFNLDVLGLRPEAVYTHYLRATELDPRNPWWWSRLICYLITVARMNKARACWQESRLHLDPEPSAKLYLELHGQIALLALHREQLDFAEEVLSEVPCDPDTDQDPLWRTLRNDLCIRKNARSELVIWPVWLPLADQFLPTSMHRLFLSSDYPKDNNWLCVQIDKVTEETIAFLGRRASTPQSVESFEVLKHNIRFYGPHEHQLSVGAFGELLPPSGDYTDWRLCLRQPGEDPIRNHQRFFMNPERYMHSGHRD